MSEGIPCPFCSAPNSGVRDSRPAGHAVPTVRRRRLCSSCGRRFTTWETYAAPTHGVAADLMRVPGLIETLAATLAQLQATLDAFSGVAEMLEADADIRRVPPRRRRRVNGEGVLPGEEVPHERTAQ